MVSLDELALGISELVESYAEDVIKEMEKVLDETADKVSLHSIKSTEEWSGIWVCRIDLLLFLKVKGLISVSPFIQAPKGRLTHLLEFGFTHRGGKFVGPRPFMRPAFDAFAPEMVEKIKSIIERGGSA